MSFNTFAEDEMVNVKVSQAEHDEIEDGETIYQIELISSAFAFHYGEDSEKQVMGFACSSVEDLPSGVTEKNERFEDEELSPLEHIRNGGKFYCQCSVEELVEMTPEIEGVFQRVRKNDSKSYMNQLRQDFEEDLQVEEEIETEESSEGAEEDE